MIPGLRRTLSECVDDLVGECRSGVPDTIPGVKDMNQKLSLQKITQKKRLKLIKRFPVVV